MKDLTKAEELVLLTIWKMGEEAYGVAIKRRIEASTGKDIPYGTLYFLLDQLTVKKFVTKKEGDPTPERGGRRKTYYRITPEGETSLKSALDLYRKMWGDVNPIALEGNA